MAMTAQPSQYGFRTLRVVAATTMVAMMTGAVFAQDAATTAAPADAEATEEPALVAPRVRPPLLREGLRLVQATGHVDATETPLKFVLDSEDGGPEREFTLLPSVGREEMERVLDVAGGVTRFEMTGIVFVFHGQNYVLPIAAPPIQLPPAEKRDPAGDGEADGASDDPAADIERALERRMGNVPRSAAASNPPPVAPETLVPDQTQLVSRRGHIVRNSRSGNWRIVFDADAQGTADPPMDLLPCLLMERIEQYARFSTGPAPVVISGRVHVYRGRNFLLPTLYRVPYVSPELQP